MHLDWLMSPAATYAAAMLSLSTSLALVLFTKRQTARTTSLSIMPEDIRQPQDTEVNGLKAEMERLGQSVCRLEEAMPTRGAGVGLNLTKRAVAIRMLRRGEPVGIIASALESPANEIALLSKVHEMMGEKSGS
jgi:hypothetical protein